MFGGVRRDYRSAMSDTETAIEEGQVWDAHLSVKDRVGIRIVSRPTSIGPWYVVGMIPGGTVTQMSEEEIRKDYTLPPPRTNDDPTADWD